MTPRNLILSRIDGSFDPARDIAAGPWCFVGNEDVVEDWENLPFTDPFPDRSSLIQADASTRRLANHIAVSWTEKMNKEHGRDYSVAFWRNNLILWILCVTQAAWKCYRNLELLMERHGKDALSVRILENDPEWSIATFSECMDLLKLDANFNYWLNGRLLRRIAPKNWTLEPVSDKPISKTSSTNMAPHALGGQKRNRLKARIGRLGFDHVLGTKYSRPFFALLINLLPRRRAESRPFVVDNAVLDEFPQAFVNILMELLEATCPATFGEGFRALEKEAKGIPYSFGRLTITHAGTVDAKLQMINAFAVEAGERLVGFQHGGVYGTAQAIPWPAESEYTHHAFMTWGWTEQGDYPCKMVPLPSPELSRIRNKHRFKTADLVFVGHQMYVQNGRIDSGPSPKKCLSYRRKKKTFIENLDRKPTESLEYRPYSRAVQLLEEESFLERHFPGLRVFLGHLESKILGCRLLVLDHPGTTLHQAMAANVPLVCYWDRDEWPCCPEAENAFEPLRRCGILFDNPADAARHINTIWGDVPGWWNDESVQEARRTWAESYARTSPVWWWHWARALLELSGKRGSIAPALNQTAKSALSR